MGEQGVRFDIPAGRRSALTARRHVAATLDAWGLEAVRRDAELIVSELMTNAVMHAPGPGDYELRITRSMAGVRISISDGCSDEPAIRTLDDGFPGGRGLHIVAALASAWGFDPIAHGKRVWADLRVPSSQADLA